MSASLDGAVGVLHLLSESSTVSTYGAVSKCLSVLIDTMGQICKESMKNARSPSDAANILSLLGKKYFNVLELIKHGNLSDTITLTLCHTILDYLQGLTQELKAQEQLNPTDSDCISFLSEVDRMKIQDPFIRVNNTNMRFILEGIINGSFGFAPDTSCFNRLLRVYVRLGDETSAEALYHRLVHDVQFSTFLDLTTFCIMTHIFLLSKHKDSAQKCLNVVEELQSYLSSSTSTNAVHDNRKINFCFNSAISKLCKTKNPIFIQHAYDLLIKRDAYCREMGSIDIIHYNMVLSSLLQGGIVNPCTKARDILQYMRQNREAGSFGPDVISLTHVIQIFLKFGKGRHSNEIMDLFEQMDQIDGFPFDAMVFEFILHALTSGENLKDSSNAKRIFQRMRELSDQNKVPVTVTACNIFLKALSLSAEDCHDALIQMIQDFNGGTLPALPDRVGFNTVIQAWSSYNGEKAFERALEVLDLMIALNDKDPKRNVGPDHFTVSGLLSVILNSHRAQAGIKADELMTRISNLPDLDLDGYVYNRHLSAWAKSSSKVKLQRVLEILQESQRVGRVDLVSYNTALNAFAHSNTSSLNINEKEEALRNALKVYDELRSSKHLEPDDVTFTTMVRVINSLCSNKTQRDEELFNLFKDYCRLGIVTQSIIRLICGLFPDIEHRKGIIKHSLEGKLDNNWTRNVQHKVVRLQQYRGN